MCDYSLMGVPNRLAAEGEELVTHRYASGAMGFTSSRLSAASARRLRFWPRTMQWLSDQFSDDVNQPVAVCIPPGALLLVRDMPGGLRRSFRSSCTELVTFTQLSATENSYRDAIRLLNGAEILLQRLRPGQRVRVLRLSLSGAALAPDAARFMPANRSSAYA